MLNVIKKIYTALPCNRVSLLKYIPDQFLYGSRYQYIKNNISISKSELGARLLRQLTYTRNHTAFGKENIPKEIQIDEVFSVLEDVPEITSSDLAENIGYFKSDEYNKLNSYLTTTGGTGRNPTTILLSNESYGVEWAHMIYIWENLGYVKKKHTKLTLRGKKVKGDKTFIYNPIYNEVVVDIFSLSSSNFKRHYQELIRKYKIDYIHGYPSLVKEYMSYLQENNLELKLKGVMLGSEGIGLQEKNEIADFFRCGVISWYGQSEKVILAADFNQDGRFIVLTSYGYPRIVDADINAIGEIAGTTFVNKALPLINYKTGDYGKLDCGQDRIELQKIKGRWGKDYVYLNEEKKIPTSAINLHSNIQQEILFYQIVQKEYGRLLVRILPKSESNLTDGEIQQRIVNELKEKLSGFTISSKVVKESSEIVRSSRGKMMYLLQNLNTSK